MLPLVSSKGVLCHNVDFARWANWLDHVYTKIKDSKQYAIPTLDSLTHHCDVNISILTTADQNKALFCPEGAMSALQDWFDCTDWSVFREAATKDEMKDIGKYAEVVSG